MLILPPQLRLVIVLLSCLPIAPVNGLHDAFPTPTFAGMRAAQVGLDLQPTANPGSPSELLRRLNGDPAICGWVDGNGNNTVSCNSGYSCAASSTFVGCCSKGPSGCEVLFTTCYDVLGKSCDSACSADKGALICGNPEPYCATYRYASGSQGYGCAGYIGYNKTVLTTTTSNNASVTPFGQGATTTSSSSTSSISTSSAGSPLAIATASPTMAPMNMTSISGGAIAGIVVGAVVVLGVIVWIVVFVLRRNREKKRQMTEANRASNQSYPFQDRYISTQYPKTDPKLYSSPPLGHSRKHSELDGGSQSEPGVRSLSPETIMTGPQMSPNLSEMGPGSPVELSAVDRRWSVRKH